MVKASIIVICLIFYILPGSAQEYKLPDLSILSKDVQSINVDTSYSNGNWKPILDAIKNKRIVLLGELNHGSREIFLSRNDLIKSLHKELGFKTILFESGIGELIEINSRQDNFTAAEMINGLFGVWRTDEFVQLMEYVKSNNISISGFDVQKSGGSFEKTLTDELKRLNLYANKYADIEKRFTEENGKLTNRKVVYDSVKTSTNDLIKDYESLWHSIEESDGINKNEISYFVIRTIQNRIHYLKYYLNFVEDKDWNKRFRVRDSMMFSNIHWLLNSVYKDQKVIIIAHNYHISKFNEKEEVMGEFLRKEYELEMYSVGAFAGSGSYSNNNGIAENLKPISNTGLDIKSLIIGLHDKVSFLNVPKMESKEHEWLFNKIIVNDTFIDSRGSNEMILAKCYDGLLFIDKVSPAKK